MIDAIDNSIGVDTPVQLTVTDSCGGAPFNANITVINQGIYVNVNTGNDVTGNGSVSNPYKTITKALSVTLGNEDIYIASGTYDTAAGEVFPLSLKAGTHLIGATTPTKPFITNFGATQIIIGGSGNEINNLEIYGSAGVGSSLISSASTITIRNCIIHGDGESNNSGVFVAYGCNILDSSIYDFNGMGIDFSGSQPCLIEGNYIYFCSEGISTNSSPVIRNNLISDNGYGITVHPIGSPHPRINNNSFFCNLTANLYIFQILTLIDARNNTWGGSSLLIDSTGTCGGVGVDICYDASFPTPEPLYSGYSLMLEFCGGGG
jgi:parallel beta-helix repeat protein